MEESFIISIDPNGSIDSIKKNAGNQVKNPYSGIPEVKDDVFVFSFRGAKVGKGLAFFQRLALGILR